MSLESLKLRCKKRTKFFRSFRTFYDTEFNVSVKVTDVGSGTVQTIFFSKK